WRSVGENKGAQAVRDRRAECAPGIFDQRRRAVVAEGRSSESFLRAARRCESAGGDGTIDRDCYRGAGDYRDSESTWILVETVKKAVVLYFDLRCSVFDVRCSTLQNKTPPPHGPVRV